MDSPLSPPSLSVMRLSRQHSTHRYASSSCQYYNAAFQQFAHVSRKNERNQKKSGAEKRLLVAVPSRCSKNYRRNPDEGRFVPGPHGENAESRHHDPAKAILFLKKTCSSHFLWEIPHIIPVNISPGEFPQSPGGMSLTGTLPFLLPVSLLPCCSLVHVLDCLRL